MRPWEFPSAGDIVAEVLLRHHLGEFEPRVRDRLADIFTLDGLDLAAAEARILKAAEYLGIDGTHLEAKGREALAHSSTYAPANLGTSV